MKEHVIQASPTIAEIREAIDYVELCTRNNYAQLAGPDGVSFVLDDNLGRVSLFPAIVDNERALGYIYLDGKLVPVETECRVGGRMRVYEPGEPNPVVSSPKPT